MSQENGRETANRIGTINSDRSQDFGCFVVNNEAHPEFFASQNWSDPVSNSRYAYSIFLARGNWSAWYAVCTRTGFRSSRASGASSNQEAITMTKSDKIEILALLICLPIIGLMLVDALGGL
jgi:hypothetical protein